MLAATSVIAVVLVSLLITRVATVVLTLTGMSPDSARFQARSALSGVGFTTSEAESVVEHPVRRRVVMALMLVGSAGIVTVIATIILSLEDADPEQRWTRLAVVIGGLFLLWLLARSRVVDRYLSTAIAGLLTRFTDLEARDYAALLHLSDDYAVKKLAVRAGSWLAGRSLREVRARGVVVLGIERREESYVGAPTLEAQAEAGDTLIAYGRREDLGQVAEESSASAG